MFSDNAPTLDLVRISNDRPAALPWVLRVLGPAGASLFVADLGDDRQIHPRTKLVGYHIAFLPHPNFELGAEVIDAMGGRGGQPASFGDRVLDAIPLIDAIFRSGTDFEFSNKMAASIFVSACPHGADSAVWWGAPTTSTFAAAQRATRGQRMLGVSLGCLLDARDLAFAPNIVDRHSVLHTDYPLSARGICSATR